MLLHCGRYKFSLDRALVMGIVNVTPDSFTDGGLYDSAERAVSHAVNLIEEGADILDIGGESTRPGSIPVSISEELHRVIPVIKELAGMNVPVSVDTSKPEVMQAAVDAGAVMINDVNALQAPGALNVAVSGQVAVCLMHMHTRFHTGQAEPHYGNVVAEVRNFLQERLNVARAAGILEERLVIDPGFGFGKKPEHNFQLLQHLDHFTGMGVPVLAGLSRKSMLGRITGKQVGERIYASIAAALLAVSRGAGIVRVHDVRATREALAVYDAMTSADACQ